MRPGSQAPCLAEAQARVEARALPKLLVERLALGERGRHGDRKHGVQVAGAAARLGQALAAEAKLLAGASLPELSS